MKTDDQSRMQEKLAIARSRWESAGGRLRAEAEGERAALAHSKTWAVDTNQHAANINLSNRCRFQILDTFILDVAAPPPPVAKETDCCSWQWWWYWSGSPTHLLLELEVGEPDYVVVCAKA